MLESQYFSNSYKGMIKNKLFHFLTILLENFITLIIQITLYIMKFTHISDEKTPILYFYSIFIQQINKLPEYTKLTLIIIIFVLIIIYFFVYTKFSFENEYLFNKIVINIFEIFIFRLIVILIFHILLAIEGIAGIIMIILSIPIIFLIMENFSFNHLYYFSPHFIVSL